MRAGRFAPFEPDGWGCGWAGPLPAVLPYHGVDAPQERMVPVFLTHRIEEMIATSNDTRRAIGTFVLRERAHLADYTIADIAEATFSSKPSVTRFAKALGFDGWRDFLRAFTAEVHFEQAHEAAVDPNYPFAATDTDEQIVNAIADVHRDAIADTLRTLNRGALALGVRYLQQARAVWVFGQSPNSYLGELFCRKMLTVGKPAHIAQSGERGIITRTLGPDDCAIMISYGGNNPDMDPMTHLAALIERRVPVIGITSEGENYLRRNLRCVLTISSRENLNDKIATFSTEESIQLLLDCLFACYFARSYDENVARKVSTARILERGRSSVIE